MLNLCIYHKDVSFIIDKNITRHYIPNLVLTVPETAILSGLREAEGSQIGVNLNLCGWMGIGYSWLDDNRLNGAPIKPCKAIKGISGIWKKGMFSLPLGPGTPRSKTSIIGTQNP